MKNMKIKIFSTLVFVFSATLALVGIASASTVDTLQPASTITYNEEVVVNDTIRVDSAYIGKQDVGGVTFFNGTIVNSTTTDGVDNPVTFGDDVRIDGEIYRTQKGDDPLKISDTVIPTMDNTNDLGSSANQWKDGYFAGTLNIGALGGTGVVAAGNLADNAVTGAKIAAGTIAGADIGSEVIEGSHMADNSVTPDKISGEGGANLPVAYGLVNNDGGTYHFVGGTSNVSSATRTALGTFEVSLKDITFDQSGYLVVVTPNASWPSDYSASYISSGGNLIVYTRDAANMIDLNFSFIVYKL